jgi:hypothetical protein
VTPCPETKPGVVANGCLRGCSLKVAPCKESAFFVLVCQTPDRFPARRARGTSQPDQSLAFLCGDGVPAVLLWADVRSGSHLSPVLFALVNKRLVWPFFAMTFAALALWTGWREERSPPTIFGIWLIGVAAFLWWLPVSPLDHAAVLRLAAGFPLAVTDAFRLFRFLRTPVMPCE